MPYWMPASPCAGNARPAKKSGKAVSAARSALRWCWSATICSPPTSPARRSSSRPRPTAFKLVAENRLGGEVRATPAICGRPHLHACRHFREGPAPGNAVLPGQERIAWDVLASALHTALQRRLGFLMPALQLRGRRCSLLAWHQGGELVAVSWMFTSCFASIFDMSVSILLTSTRCSAFQMASASSKAS